MLRGITGEAADRLRAVADASGLAPLVIAGARHRGAVVRADFGYRQLTAVWRLQGWWAGITNRQQVRGEMTRTGSIDADAAVAPVLSGGGQSDGRD